MALMAALANIFSAPPFIIPIAIGPLNSSIHFTHSLLVEFEGPYSVIPQQFLFGFGLETQIFHLIHTAFKGKQGVIRAPQNLVLPPGITVFLEWVGPKLGGTRRGLHVNIGKLPGQGHHLIVPGLAQVRSHDRQIGKAKGKFV